jgi:hypothetical protein
MASDGKQAPLKDISNGNVAPLKPSAKASAAAPMLSEDDHVEMKDMLPGGPEPEDDIMQLARLGDTEGIQKLFNSGKYDATFCDNEGITPLHVSNRQRFGKSLV